MALKKINKEIYLTFIFGYIIFQVTWTIIWTVVLGLTFPGDRVDDSYFFVWESGWGLFIGDLIHILPILITTVLAYLFSNKSSKVAFITFIGTSIIFIIMASLMLNGAYFNDLFKHFNYAISN